jgi:hypothetical protein
MGADTLLLNIEAKVKTIATANFNLLEKEIRQKRVPVLYWKRQKQDTRKIFIPKYRLRSRQMNFSPLELISQKLFILSKQGELGIWSEGSTKIKNEFVKSYEKIVCDRATGLMWQQSGSEKRVEYNEAKKLIIELNKNNFNGFNDWRLPTIEELNSLYGYGKMEPDGGEPGQEPDWIWNPFSLEFEQVQEICWSCDIAVSGKYHCPAKVKRGQDISLQIEISLNSLWAFDYSYEAKFGILCACGQNQKNWVRAVRTMKSIAG